MILVFPVAGRGARFYPQTAQLPKCLIPVRGRLMIEWALDSIHHEDHEVLFIYHHDQLPLIRHALRDLMPAAQFFEQSTPLGGAADTVFQAREIWEPERDVVIVDCDIHAVSEYQHRGWHLVDGDGSVLVFASNDPMKSYVKLNDGLVVDAVEKEPVSDLAIGGIYHFRSGAALAEAMQDLFTSDDRVQGEFYVSGALRRYLERRPRIRVVRAEAHFDLGMPEGVKEFEACAL
jgi:glucose-1-phosphate thymidylyltransferase